MSYLVARPSRDVLAAGRQEITREWWEQHIADFDVFVSGTVLEESAQGDDAAAQRRLSILSAFAILEITPSIESLASEYIENGIVPDDYPGDALHLAYAVVYELELLVTWNFKHLANVFVQRRLKDFNLRKGLYTPTVCSPEELLGE